MKIKLPEIKSKDYASNPLKLKDGEVREVEHNKEIDLLLNNGAIEPVTSTPSIESAKKEDPKKVIVDKPIVTKPTTPTIKTAPILKKKGFQRKS